MEAEKVNLVIAWEAWSPFWVNSDNQDYCRSAMTRVQDLQRFIKDFNDGKPEAQALYAEYMTWKLKR